MIDLAAILDDLYAGRVKPADQPIVAEAMKHMMVHLHDLSEPVGRTNYSAEAIDERVCELAAEGLKPEYPIKPEFPFK